MEFNSGFKGLTSSNSKQKADFSRFYDKQTIENNSHLLR